jgi:hypothetical protein
MNSDLEREEFLSILEELIDEGLLVRDSPEHGAAKQYIAQGVSSLSNKQKFNFETKVHPLIEKKWCPIEGCDGRVHAGFSMCSYHQSLVEKASNED